jgi:purine-binding chemotaxis protein CheW
MTNQEAPIEGRAKALRRAFDESFARLPVVQERAAEAFLAIDLAGDGYALRLAQVAGLHADKRVTALPSDVPELLGLANFRGTLIPAYDLRMLLGYPPGPPLRWMVLVASPIPVGLAFDRFEGHLAISDAEVIQEESTPNAPSHARAAQAVRVGDKSRKIIDLNAIVESISQRVQAGNMRKEQ